MQDEWIVGQSIDGDRDYVLHLHAPRFIAEIATDVTGSVRAEEIEFLDGEPEGDIERHREEAADAFIEWERKLEAEIAAEDAD